VSGSTTQPSQYVPAHSRPDLLLLVATAQNPICVNRACLQTVYNAGCSPKRAFMRKFLFPRLSAAFTASAALVIAAGLFSSAARAANVIVLNSGEATLSLIDEATRQVVGTVPTGKEPHHLMATPDNSSLIVANSVSNNLMFVDPKTGKVQRWVENIEDPYQIGFSPDRKWVVTTGLRLDRLDIYHYDGHDMTLARRLPLAVMPSHMAFSNDSKTVFITLQVSGELAAIDLATHRSSGR